MKRIVFSLAILLAAQIMMAQPNYKYILQHLEEWSERESLYELHAYQQAFPQKPHVYYLMANINFELQKKEHPLVNYLERKRMLYDARVYYGNCRAYMNNDKINGTMYPLVADDKGKVSEGQLYNWLNLKIDSLAVWMDELDTLYDCYGTLVNRYDQCVQLFSQYMTKYDREKDALLMMDSLDEKLLTELSTNAKQLTNDILAYDKALKKVEIEGYSPKFSFRPISYFRVEGLTCSDFLSNEVVLWDYAQWTDEFMREEAKVKKLKAELANESNSLDKKSDFEAALKENTLLLNRIRQYDETSVIADFLHYEFLVDELEYWENRIIRDSLAEEDWLGCLQMAERHVRLAEECEQQEQLVLQGLQLHQDDVKAKYTSFVMAENGRYWMDEGMKKWQSARLQSSLNVRDWVVAQAAMPQQVQISEFQIAKIEDGKLLFEDIIPQSDEE